jgi:hypothetical protein
VKNEGVCDEREEKRKREGKEGVRSKGKQKAQGA